MPPYSAKARNILAGRRAIAVWVAALASIAVIVYAVFFGNKVSGLAADSDDAAQVALGRHIYDRECASCHGDKLQGQPNWRQRRPNGRLPAPPHDDTGHTWHHPDALLFALTKLGPAALAGPGYRSDMPAYAGRLSDREIWAVLAYIKSRWSEAVRERQAAITRRARKRR